MIYIYIHTLGNKHTKEETRLQWYGWGGILINEGRWRVSVERFDWSVFLTSHAAASPLSADHSSPYTPRDPRNTPDTPRDTYPLRRSPPPEGANTRCSELGLQLTNISIVNQSIDYYYYLFQLSTNLSIIIIIFFNYRPIYRLFVDWSANLSIICRLVD